MRKYTASRGASILGAAVGAAIALAGCGSGKSGEIVARVAGVGAISKATLDHWIRVEAVIIYEENPTKPVPMGLIPDPPGYSACIAYLAKTRQKLTESDSTPTATEIKSRCVRRYQELKVLTLNTLIGWDWTIDAGIKLGLKVNDAEVMHRLHEVNGRFFPAGGAFAKYLKLTGQTVGDMLFRSKVQLLEVKLSQKLTTMEKSLPKGLDVRQRQSALAALTTYLPPGKQWAAITSCRAGYVVSGCKQYTGDESPGFPN